MERNEDDIGPADNGISYLVPAPVHRPEKRKLPVETLGKATDKMKFSFVYQMVDIFNN
ncbi:MAG: hypothetical protein WCZ72_07650 [Gemmobacter sp.]